MLARRGDVRRRRGIFRLVLLVAAAAGARGQGGAAARDMFYSPAAPLGLRYSVLQETAGGGVMETDPESVFRSGDRIRLAIEANERAHLYIVQRGSSGNWSLLFPSPEIAGGENVIEKGRRYETPAGYWFAFDEQPGKERLFVVLARRPEPDLGKMIQALGRQDGGPQQRGLDDAAVARIRSRVGARDLLFEKVAPAAAGGKKETAVYVVNQTGAADSRVVADVVLNHQ